MIHNDKEKAKEEERLLFYQNSLDKLEEDTSKYAWRLLLLTHSRIHELQKEISEYDNYSAKRLISQLIRSFVKIDPASYITEEAIRMSYYTDRQIKMLIEAKDFVYAT